MPKKILVAGESPAVRNVSESVLRKHGYEVLLADDGAKALGMAEANKPDLILLDESLSIVDGEQVCRELKQNDGLKDIPVVMLLSGDETEKKEKLSLIGAQTFIIKPFNLTEILDHAERLLQKEQTLPSGDEQRITEDPSPAEEEKSDEKETQKPAPPEGGEKSEDVLDIVEISDFMESLKPAAPVSDGEAVHGFHWFMSELKKETLEDEKADSQPKEKPTLSEQKLSDKKSDDKEESKIYEIDEHQKGYEDFLKDLKQEVDEVDKEESTLAKPSTVDKVSWSQFDLLLSDLRERISERVAHEVAKKITPEFLEKVIREEMAKMGKDSS